MCVAALSISVAGSLLSHLNMNQSDSKPGQSFDVTLDFVPDHMLRVRFINPPPLWAMVGMQHSDGCRALVLKQKIDDLRALRNGFHCKTRACTVKAQPCKHAAVGRGVSVNSPCLLWAAALWI